MVFTAVPYGSAGASYFVNTALFPSWLNLSSDGLMTGRAPLGASSPQWWTVTFVIADYRYGIGLDGVALSVSPVDMLIQLQPASSLQATCPIPGEIQNTTSAQDLYQTVNYPNSVTYTCIPGYVLNGDARVS